MKLNEFEGKRFLFEKWGAVGRKVLGARPTHLNFHRYPVDQKNAHII